MVAPISVDIGTSGALALIDHALTRRHDDRVSLWEALRAELQALSVAINTLDSLYVSLLGEFDDIARRREVSRIDLEAALREARRYCRDRQLMNRIVQLRAGIGVAAESEDLKKKRPRERYRELAKTLKSIDERLGSYLNRQHRITQGSRVDSEEGTERTDLRRILDTFEPLISSEFEIDAELLRELSEEAIRNSDSDLSEDLLGLIGKAQEQLSFLRL